MMSAMSGLLSKRDGKLVAVKLAISRRMFAMQTCRRISPEFAWVGAYVRGPEGLLESFTRINLYKYIYKSNTLPIRPYRRI